MAESRGGLALFDAPRRAGRPRGVRVGREFVEAVGGAEHLRLEDRALIELGRRLAAEIDDTDDVKTLAMLTGHMLGVIDRLGMSPKGRAALALEVPPLEEGVNPFDALTLIRDARRAAEHTGT